MSWVDKIKDSLLIITGDGAQFTPSWLNASYGKEFNVTKYDFPNLGGTLVRRKYPMGRELILELYFTGADHLDTVSNFDKSSDDLRVWTLEHPYYGVMYVQPLAFNVDNSLHNVSKVVVPVMETILDDNPRIQLSPIETVAFKKELLDETFTQSMTAQITPTDINNLKSNSNRNYKLAIPVFKVPDELTEYTNLFNKADSAVSRSIQFPLDAIRTLSQFISYPSRLSQDIKSRIALFKDQFENYRKNIANYTSVSSKQLYQITAGNILSSMAVAATIPFKGDYRSATETLDIMDDISEAYDTYMEDLDFLGGDTGGSPDSFIADPDSIIDLSLLISLTISSLFNIALSAKKERSMITEYDTNIIILTHRLYGLDPTDDNINELMGNNNIGLNEIFLIKKDRKIIYYI